MANDLERQLAGYSLVTAEIIYGMPDHPDLVQSFIWQFYDRAPDFPEIRKFCAWWQKNLDGPIREVKVTYQPVIGAARVRFLDGMFTVN